jgi:hypothetical protein
MNEPYLSFMHPQINAKRKMSDPDVHHFLSPSPVPGLSRVRSSAISIPSRSNDVSPTSSFQNLHDRTHNIYFHITQCNYFSYSEKSCKNCPGQLLSPKPESCNYWQRRIAELIGTAGETSTGPSFDKSLRPLARHHQVDLKQEKMDSHIS